jgi:NADH:ubiquinone oxidoreductase subunit 5 (subunit L)/multisubunit Na+/H+ antiporter MnhA subunit
MFFMVGVLYDRVHHRNLEEFGGIFNRMPVYSGLAIAVFFAGLGLPGLCGFIGEVLVTLSSWNYSRTLAAISAFTVILTAAYILWAIQRVYLGAEYRGPHGDHLTPITGRELAIAAPLVFFAILFGVAPQLIFNYVTPSVNRQVETLADWTRRIDSRYCMVSLPPSFVWPADSDLSRLISEVVLPHCREHGQAFAMMMGVKRAVNPALRMAGDGVGLADLSSLQRLCAEHSHHQRICKG